MISVYDACKQQGMKLLNIGIGSAVTTDFLKSPGMDGYLSFHLVAPFTDTSTPALQEFQAATVKYTPKASLNGAAISMVQLLTYSAGKMFEVVVKSGKLGNGATAADVMNAMYTVPAGETLGGLIPPTSYVKGKAFSTPCYFLQQIKNGAFTSPQGLKPTCLGQ